MLVSTDGGEESIFLDPRQSVDQGLPCPHYLRVSRNTNHVQKLKTTGERF